MYNANNKNENTNCDKVDQLTKHIATQNKTDLEDKSNLKFLRNCYIPDKTIQSRCNEPIPCQLRDLAQNKFTFV